MNPSDAMISSICMMCFKPQGCRRSQCAFSGHNWKAPLRSLQKAAALTLPSTAVVVGHDDIFKMWDYDQGWDLDVGSY